MYIKTKNRIYKVESETCNKKGYFVGEYDVILKEQVVKQSEKLEELCDEFVVCGKEYNYNFVWNEERNAILNSFCSLPKKYDVYGCIWTSKGLIYVAKMNDKGDLELI